MSVYNQMTIVVSQQLDPRVKRNSDAGRIGIELWLENVPSYTARPEVQQYMKMRQAIAEGNVRKDFIQAEQELKDLVWSVGNGQLTRAYEEVKSSLGVFLPEVGAFVPEVVNGGQRGN